MNEHEFLNADKSNLALQTQYFTDSLKNFNDIAVHSKMMLELIAKRILGQPKVIPTVYLTDGDFSPPVDEVVAIRAMVMSTQTTPVVITVNGIIPMLVSTVPTQIVTGPISSVTVGNTVPGNPVYVQYLDERAALLSNTSTQDDVAVNGTVSLTGSLAPLTANPPTLIATVAYTQLSSAGELWFTFGGVLHRNARARTFYIVPSANLNNLSTVGLNVFDSQVVGGGGGSQVISSHSPGFNTDAAWTAIPGEVLVVDSAAATIAAATGDSVLLLVDMSAAATAGNIEIYVTELF